MILAYMRPKRCKAGLLCCISDTFFPKLCIFPEIDSYFCMFLMFIERRMIRTIILGIFLILFQMLLSPAFAQSDAGASIVSAVESMQKGDFKRADDVLKEIISSDPESDGAWYYLGLNYIHQKDVDMAEECFRAAVKLDSTNFWYRYRLASLYEVTSRPKQTIQMYEDLMRDFPKKSDLYFDLVGLYSAQGEYEKALQVVGEIETVFGVTESIAIYRFNLLLQLQRPQEAYKSLEEYNNKYSSPYVLSVLADQSLQEYKDSVAVRYYDEALELAPDYAPALIGKAEVMRVTRRYDEYFDVLGTYVAIPEAQAQGKAEYLTEMLKRMDANFMTKFRSKFDTVIDKTLEVHPCDSNILNLVGIYHYSAGRQDKACESFRKNAEIYAESVSASASYIDILMYYQKWEEVASQARKAYETFPGRVQFLEMAVMADRLLKRNDEAIALCDKILNSGTEDTTVVARAWSVKGDVYYELKEQKKAFKAYEAALKYQPDDIYILNNYAYYLSVSGKNLKKAWQMSRKTVDAEPDNATYLDTFGWILYMMGKPEEALPHFKRAMIYGGKDSPVILDHYAEVLFALKEYDRAMVYWNKALLINNGEIEGLQDKIQKRKEQSSRKK